MGESFCSVFHHCRLPPTFAEEAGSLFAPPCDASCSARSHVIAVRASHLVEVRVHRAVIGGLGVGAGLRAGVLLLGSLRGLLVHLLADGVESLLQVLLLGLDVLDGAGLEGLLQSAQLGLALGLLGGVDLVTDLAQRLLGLEGQLLGVVAGVDLLALIHI